MKISEIQICKSPIKLAKPFVISLGPLAYAPNIIIKIKTDQGLIGFGECSPFMTINGESIDTAYIVGQYLAKKLIGQNPIKLNQCEDQLDSVIYHNYSIKSAFSIALHDIASQKAQMPLYEFLGGKHRADIITDYTVSFGPIESMANDASEIKQKGFQIIKVKLGGKIDEDLLRIKAIRNKIGNEIPLRLDANQGWSIKDAVVILQQLEGFNIEHCEEPISRDRFHELHDVSNNVSIPIMADESCCSYFDAVRLIENKSCGRLNVKLGKSGSIIEALKIIKYAEAHHIPVQIGGFLESRLGFTASAHLGLSSPTVQYFDFDTPLMQTANPITGGIEYSSEGRIKIPKAIGLGATVSDKHLDTLESTTIS